MKADGFLRATLENISRGMYDDFVESSCRSMRKAGAKAVIVRKEIGAKHNRVIASSMDRMGYCIMQARTREEIYDILSELN